MLSKTQNLKNNCRSLVNHSFIVIENYSNMQIAYSEQYVQIQCLDVFMLVSININVIHNINVHIGIDFINPIMLLSINTISNIGIDFVALTALL